MISPAHAHELQSYADHLVGRLEKSREFEEYDSSLKNRIGTAILEARRGESLEGSIDELFESDEDIRRIISHETYEAQMFARLAREDLLEPLVADPLVTQDVLSPPDDELRRWTRHIAKYREDARGAHAQRKNGAKPRTKHSRNDRADAETIWQLLALNRAAAEAGHVIRYVLITLDRSLYAAAAAWFREEGHREHRAFPLRRIGQYMPFINVAEMPNEVQSTLTFRDVRAAIDTLLSGMPGMSAWASEADLGHSGGVDAQVMPPVWQETRQLARDVAARLGAEPVAARAVSRASRLWARLGRESAFLNAELMSRRIRGFSELASFLSSSSDVRDALLQYMEKTVEDVEKAHTEFNIKHRLAVAIEAAELLSEDTATRAMFMVSTDFGELTDKQPMYEYLDAIARYKDRDALQRLYSSLSKSTHFKTLFFAGCVAFWAGGWVGAHYFADRAMQRFRRVGPGASRASSDACELTYFQAVTTRYLAMDLDGEHAERARLLRAGMELSEESERLAKESENPFALKRAVVERGLAHITLAYVLSLENDAEAATHAVAALQCLSAHAQESDELEDTLDRMLAKQMSAEVYTGLAGCLIHEFFFPGLLPQHEIDALRELSDELKVIIDDAAGIVPDVYQVAPLLLDVMFARGRDARQRASAAARERMFHGAGSTSGTTRLDRLVLESLGHRLPEAVARWVEGG
jgi:hypothetical protein